MTTVERLRQRIAAATKPGRPVRKLTRFATSVWEAEEWGRDYQRAPSLIARVANAGAYLRDADERRRRRDLIAIGVWAAVAALAAALWLAGCASTDEDCLTSSGGKEVCCRTSCDDDGNCTSRCS